MQDVVEEQIKNSEDEAERSGPPHVQGDIQTDTRLNVPEIWWSSDLKVREKTMEAQEAPSQTNKTSAILCR